MKFVYPPGATPLSAEDLEGLIPEHLTQQAELDAWEQENILAARERLARQRPRDLLTDSNLRKVHGWMFEHTWTWAGHYRTSGKNIGCDWTQIPEQVRVLCDDVRYQLVHGTYPQNEIAVRFHHRLTSIHPFANGNGRHARLMTDLLLESQGQARFTWGAQDLAAAGAARDRYLAALRAADAGDYAPLQAFVHS